MTDKPEIDLPFVERLLRDIAARLGDGWTPVKVEGHDRLRRERDGASFTISVNAKERRLAVFGQWPEDNGRLMSPTAYGVDGHAPMINVSVDRGAATIARDIAKRFLSDFLATHEACLVALRERHEARAAAEACIGRIRRLVGGNRSDVSPGALVLAQIEGTDSLGRSWRAEVEVIHEIDLARLALRGPRALIEDVIRGLKGKPPANENDHDSPEPSNDNNAS